MRSLRAESFTVISCVNEVDTKLYKYIGSDYTNIKNSMESSQGIEDKLVWSY